MNIGFIGTGNIGGTLARKLSAAGHDVRVANSRGPEGVLLTAPLDRSDCLGTQANKPTLSLTSILRHDSG